jgi:phosphoketolase
VLGSFLRDVTKLNQEPRHFRIFGPDETVSNLLEAVFEVTDRQWEAKLDRNDEFLAPAGTVLNAMLSEHQCEGWLEGYLLTGRHGLFNSYEAFIRIVDSMFSQHAKWLKVTSGDFLRVSFPGLKPGFSPGPGVWTFRAGHAGKISKFSEHRRDPTSPRLRWASCLY